MADQEKEKLGISLWAIQSDFAIESLDGENLRVVVEGWPQNVRHRYRMAAEIVCNDPAWTLEKNLEESETIIRENPGKYDASEIQPTIDLLSLKPGNLERVYIALKEVEQDEMEKRRLGLNFL